MNIQLPVHSHLGPSSAHRWMNCAGSPNLIAKLGLPQDDGSEEAALGTVCHEVTAECLIEDREPWEFGGQVRKHGKFEFTIDKEITPRIERCLQYVRDTFAQYEPMGAVLYSETRVHSDLDPEAYGTADIRIEVPGLCIIIIDFKFGMVRVDPDDEQLKEYGYLSYERRSAKMRGAGEPRMIELIIAQPRLPNPGDHFRKYTTTPAALQEWFVGETLPAMQATRNPNAPLTMGDWCKFCSANTTGKCPAVFKAVETLPLAAHPSSFTGEKLGELKRLKPIIDKFFLGIDLEVLTRMRDKGEVVPGFKIVHKLGHRVWKSSVTLKQEDGTIKTFSNEEFLRNKFGDDAFKPALVKSPAQIEELPGGKAATALLAFKPDTGLTVAPEDDTREIAVGLMARAAAEGALAI